MTEHRNWADTLFGSALVVLSLIAFTALSPAAVVSRGGWNAWVYPTGVVVMLGLVGMIIVGRSFLLRWHSAPRWTTLQLFLTSASLAAVPVLLWLASQTSSRVSIIFGPAEYAMLIVLTLAISIALAARSRLRALAMALAGLLLATVGIDVNTGAARLTFDFSDLGDGIEGLTLRLGLLVVADALLCLVTPAAYIASYRAWIAGAFDRAPSTAVSVGLRLAGAIAVVAAVYVAYLLNNSSGDVLLVLVFGLVGVGCKLAGANRLVLLVAFALGALLETDLSRAMLLSLNDPMTFLQRPLSAVFIVLALATLVIAITLSLRRRRRNG